jgi:hypothetical protein
VTTAPTAHRVRSVLGGATALPSETTVRFAVLVMMVLATTSIIGSRVWLDRLAADSPYQECAAGLARLGATPTANGRPSLAFTSYAMCLRPEASLAVRYALGACLLLVVAAAGAYLLMPHWRIRIRRLRRMSTHAPAGLVAHLDTLVEAAGLTRGPVFWAGPGRGADGVAFGTRRRCHVQIDAGLLVRYADPGRRAEFDAVVLHELAHIRNGDVGHTYLTVAVWRAFIVTILVPYLLLRIDDLGAVVPVLALAAVMYTAYYGILRIRELNADATAATIVDPAVLRRIIAGSRPRTLPTHPSARRRLDVLDDPARLPRTGPLVLAGAGLSVALFQANADGLGVLLLLAATSDLRTMVLLYSWTSLLTHLTTALLISSLAAIVSWRSMLRDRLLPAGSPWTGPAALAAGLTAGILAGEPLSFFQSEAAVAGLFDDAGATGLARLAAIGGLALLLWLMFAWHRGMAETWLPVLRGGLRPALFTAAAAGGLALYPGFTSWAGFHDSAVAVLAVDWRDYFPAWQWSWHPPGEALLSTGYLPLFFPATIPGVALLLAAPTVVFVRVALRQPDTRSRVGRAALSGVVAAVVCLAMLIVLADLVHTRGGPVAKQNINGAGGFLLLATGGLATAFAAVAGTAGALVAGAGRLRVPCALLAATVATAVMVPLSPIPFTLAVCGVDNAELCLPGVSMATGLTTLLGSVQGLALTGVAAALVTAILTRVPPALPHPPAGTITPRPSRAVVAGWTAAAVLLGVPLTLGSWYGYHLFTG